VTALAPLPSGRTERLVYFGTPAIAVPPLDALVANGFDVAVVVTRPDKRRGRGTKTGPSPVKSAAERLGVPVTHAVADALAAGADLGVVVAFGQLIKEPILAALPMVNLHFSLLPRWRGAAPVERAILAGDAITGVSLMQLELGLDTGPVLATVKVPIGPRETASELRAELVRSGSQLLVDSLNVGLADPEPQVGEATYAAKLDPAEFEIVWNRPAEEIDRLVRVGVAWTTFRGRRLKILSTDILDLAGEPANLIDRVTVACGTGALVLRRVQPEGKAPMDATAWANGAHPVPGERLGG
jgi:methionyl-tRNA formyltransferase